MCLHRTFVSVGVVKAGSWLEQLATGQSLAAYFCLTLPLLLTRNLK